MKVSVLRNNWDLLPVVTGRPTTHNNTYVLGRPLPCLLRLWLRGILEFRRSVRKLDPELVTRV